MLDSCYKMKKDVDGESVQSGNIRFEIRHQQQPWECCVFAFSRKISDCTKRSSSSEAEQEVLAQNLCFSHLLWQFVYSQIY